jgi:hypothetical protein
MDVFVGVYPIGADYSIPTEDFTDKLKLKMNQVDEFLPEPETLKKPPN